MNMRRTALIISLGLVVVGCNRQNRPSGSVAETGSRMSLLIQQHRFKDAAQLGINAATGKPVDAPLYYLVALAYAEQAHFEPDTVDRSLKLVSEYAQKSVALDPDDQTIRFNVAWVLEYAGDVDSSSRCKYYADSQELLNQLSRKASADDVLRGHVGTITSRITQKAKAAHCE
jgi:hypothetical protein